MIRTSQPGWNEGAITLSASRNRLRTLFRTTAPPSFRPVDRPKRVASRLVFRIRTTRRGWDLTIPCPCSAAKSSGLESITSRGGLWPRSAVRPLASCGRERGVLPGPGVPRWSSFGRGSRVLCFGAASWAERSASSEGVILSIRPRGQDFPRKARERAGRTKSAWARLPADYMYERLNVSNTRGGPTTAHVRIYTIHPDTPLEYPIRYQSEPCPCRWGGAILPRPAAPDNLGHRLKGTVRTAKLLLRRGLGSEAHGARKAIVDWCPSRFWLSTYRLLQD
jgi:hypothetical protein